MCIDYNTIIYFVALPCSVLRAPSNAKITGCTSGRIGIGHVGDICYLECIIGYQLVGNGSITCQSDGSWSDDETVCTSEYCVFFFIMYLVVCVCVAKKQRSIKALCFFISIT